MAEIVERTQTNKREDIGDVLYMCATDETPFISSVKKGRARTNTLFEEPVDLPLPPKAKGVVDEQDVTKFENTAASRTKIQARCQIFERTPKVSRLANAVSDVAGVGHRKEWARAIAKSMVAIKLDMEVRALGTDDSQEDTGTVGYETRGAAEWIKATAQSDLPVPAAYRTPAASIWASGALATFTEEDMKALLKSRWTETGKKGTLMGFCGGDFKSLVDKFTVYVPTVSNTTVVRQVSRTSDKKVTQVVDRLEFSFGNVDLYPHRYVFYDGETPAAAHANLSDDGCLLLDMEYWSWHQNQAPTRNDLPNLGGGPRAVIDAIVGLICTNPMAQAAVKPTA